MYNIGVLAWLIDRLASPGVINDPDYDNAMDHPVHSGAIIKCTSKVVRRFSDMLFVVPHIDS